MQDSFFCQDSLVKCDEVDTEAGMMELVASIREAQLPWNQKNIFTERGDGNVEYKVYNIQRDEQTKNHYYEEVS